LRSRQPARSDHLQPLGQAPIGGIDVESPPGRVSTFSLRLHERPSFERESA
jgi:hypothetical protein